MDDNKGTLLGRRRTLQLFGMGMAATGLFGLAACKDKGNATPTGDGKDPTAAGGSGKLDCSTAPDDASKAMRKTLQYKKEAVDATKKCIACAQYQEAKYGECGGCKLFTGPAQPNGGCLSFAPKGAEAGVPG